MKDFIYFDNNDTTPVLPEVLDEMLPYFTEKFGNPASLHSLGLEAENAVNDARARLAGHMNAQEDDIIFTGSATEANNFAIFGAVYEHIGKGKHIISSKVEHNAVINPLKRLQSEGFEISFLPVDSQGFVDPGDLAKAIRPDTTLVTIIHGNHEIGTIQDIPAIGKICREKGVLFHTDAAQSFTKVPLDVVKDNIDLMSINAHKFHGPKGIGALYRRRGVKLRRLMEGAPQENNMRPGTENVPYIIGFAKAADIAFAGFEKDTARMKKMRDRLIEGLLQIPHTQLNGPTGDRRLPTNADIVFSYIEGEAILMRLSLKKIAVSSGSACSSKSLTPSIVLTSIGLKHEQAHGSIRFSLSKLNTMEQVETVIKEAAQVVEQLRSMTAFIPEEHSELEGGGQSHYKKKKEENF
ncbi:MAG: cysteine desulfurase [FCB group bacterium]|nr:cysteine desulfurase [FCB group bacterium]